MTRRLLPWLVLCAIPACSSGAPSPGLPAGSGPAPAPTGTGSPTGYTSDGNVVDDVVIPMIEGAGLSVVPEDNGILCRRMAIDLTGIAPTPDEVAQQCSGHSPQDIAGYFMNKPSGINAPDGSPPYVYINRRWWADQFQYDVAIPNFTFTFYLYVQALDQAVSDLYSGKIMYDAFAKKALASPAFARRFGIFEANHDLIQIASQAYRVFLGREALPSEAQDFGNLWTAWNTQFMNETTSEATYGSQCPSFTNGMGQQNGCLHFELGLDGRECSGVNLASCQSTVMGAGQVVPTAAGFVPFSKLSAPDLSALETAGTLMAAQPEFAEAAADRALEKYLGWWKAGVYRPDYDIPAVRDALVKKLVGDGFDIRKMELEIVTSVLYTQAAALRPNENPNDPIWAFGPTKPFYAEAWLDSIGQALGKNLGGCDFRYNDKNANVVPGYLTPHPSPGVMGSFYLSSAEQMGGCPIASAHSDATGLVPSITRRAVLAQLCPGAFKPAAGATQDAIIGQVSAGFGRPLTADESGVLTSHMSVVADQGCDPMQMSGCNVQALADSLCTSLYATSLFTFY